MARLKWTPIILFVVAYTMYTFGPLLWLFQTSFRSTGEILKQPFALSGTYQLKNFLQVAGTGRYGTYYINSLLIVGGALLLLGLIASMAGYGFARFQFRGKEVSFNLMFGAVMVPLQVLIIPLMQLLYKYHLVNTRVGLVLVYTTISLPMAIYILRAFFTQIPHELAESARVDGASEGLVFWRIMLPVARPAVVTVLILNFVMLWNEFLLALLILQKDAVRTLPLGLMMFQGEYQQDIGGMSAALVLSVIPTILAYLIFSEQVIKGMTAGALKG
ncbi:MAG TPA: carbohydrate ABC transporter permease [Symbiobacteriaceae bacterium]|nr:carbohydrate ABC transporter permease [Symbiobacteriaceae bacterium]